MIIFCTTVKINSMRYEKNTVIGILAHVDAGKTTLSEAMLYLSGKIKTLGRVDHRDSYLDNHFLERERGITIFSKQARLELPGSAVTLLDTPGHADFSAEAERTLRVLDAAVLVISGTDGVQAHTETLWRLLARYDLPCFLFVSKMDLPGSDREKIMAELQRRFGEACLDFALPAPALQERLALCSEEAMEKYLSEGKLEGEDISALIHSRRLFPCFFGSGLRLEGVEALLAALDRFVRPAEAGERFGARVYQIGRDAQGNRLSYMKITGGCLRVRDTLAYKDAGGAPVKEKVSGLRLYSGAKYENTDCVYPGQVCAVPGLGGTWAGQGLGAENNFVGPALESALQYRLRLPEGADPAALLPKLMLLQEEEPQLHIHWNAGAGEISLRLMGRIQEEIFKSLVKERFDLALELDSGSVMYKETIADTVEGVGHFEPLRHYAEVHLIMEPLPPGSGLVIDSICPEDALDRNWQRLILSHLREREHPGVLTGAPITDMKISLAAGKAHLKHTEGGDFRQAVFRALRQGLMQAKSVLLEPWYAFTIEVPPEQTGRAINDIRAMHGEFSSPEDAGGLTRLRGGAPFSGLRGYGEEVRAYTRGRGRFSMCADGYRPCHDQKSAVEALGYDAESDTENPSASVFCAHGAGFSVKWDKVPDYMHLESCLKKTDAAPAPVHRCLSIDQRELDAIMEREFGPIRRRSYAAPVKNQAPERETDARQRQQYIIVDGYNLIFAWDELRALAAERLDLARGRLMDMLSSYCGYTKAELVLVFDGFRTPGNPGSRSDYHNIHLVFTADGETGDAYIERLADRIGKNNAVRVVTSDNLIRLSALRSGVLRCSSAEFKAELEQTLKTIDDILRRSSEGAHMTRLKDGKQ